MIVIHRRGLGAFQDAGGGLLVDDVTGNVYNATTGEIYTTSGVLTTPGSKDLQAAFQTQQAINAALQQQNRTLQAKVPTGTGFSLASVPTWAWGLGIALAAVAVVFRPGR